MNKNKKTKVTNDLEIVIIPNQEHEFLMTSKEVALAYGIDRSRLSHHAKSHSDELYENKHYLKGMLFPYTLQKNAQPHQVFWTKRGIVRLGFFIKSERARLFRDWAEDLVIEQLENQNTKQVLQQLPEAPKRKHNRLTVEHINDLMKYVCMIEDKSLRMILSDKLNNN